MWADDTTLKSILLSVKQSTGTLLPLHVAPGLEAEYPTSSCYVAHTDRRCQALAKGWGNRWFEEREKVKRGGSSLIEDLAIVDQAIIALCKIRRHRRLEQLNNVGMEIPLNSELKQNQLLLSSLLTRVMQKGACLMPSQCPCDFRGCCQDQTGTKLDTSARQASPITGYS